jgi:riboflavin biosynthesis pyrimidine reductase
VEAGLVDDIQIHVAPLLLGDGVRLSAGLAKAPVSLTTVRVCDSPSGVTHLHFRITR